MEDKNTAGGASAAAAKDTTVKQTIPFAKSGEVLTNWINRRLSEKGNVTVLLGTKRATVTALLPDGSLKVEVPDADGATSVEQKVEFDATMFDLLVPNLATI